MDGSGGRGNQNIFSDIPGGESPPDYVPAAGQPHRYFFKVYALDTTLSLKSGAAKSQLETAMSGHIPAQEGMTGEYGR